MLIKPFYAFLLVKSQKTGEKLPWNHADVFLAILLSLETRLNVLGSDGGILGTEPAK